MTDRHNAVVVTFDKLIREDDLEAWMNAIAMMKNVIDVRPVPSDGVSAAQAVTWQVEDRYRKKLMELYDETLPDWLKRGERTK